MSKQNYRKPKPSPPRWYFWDNDNCWFCKLDYRTCGGCKKLKYFKKKRYESRNESKRILREYQE